MKNLVILHGLGRTSRSMKFPEKIFGKMGYDVTNIGYPSTRLSIHEIAKEIISPIILKLGCSEPIYFLTHSMGGIILRYTLQVCSVPFGSRAVMLAPPNQGSEVIDFLQRRSLTRFLGKLFLGPAGMSLSTDSKLLENILPTKNLEIGIIAGRKKSYPFFSPLFNEDNDGKVSIKSALTLKEKSDSVIVHHSHTFMMNEKDTIININRFFNKGSFRA